MSALIELKNLTKDYGSFPHWTTSACVSATESPDCWDPTAQGKAL
ncbi:MAG: hypothetical protein R3C19_21915 [Planctomycetaceae bacterium]